MKDKVMIIAPHPDDAEIAMGGTIARLTQAGVAVVVVDLTNGEPTPHGSPEIRAKETAAASKVLGVTERVLLDLPNREVFDTTENRNKVANVIREHKPNILFAPYWEDTHPDHTESLKLIEAARFYSKFVKSDLFHQPHYPRKLFHFLSTHIRPKVTPSFVFDISSTFEKKMESLKCYHSQFIAHEKNQVVFEALENENRFWGRQAGVRYGEPFVCREQIVISNEEALLEL